jgi:predicted TIM-barrel fold metal-dependent hydrolase
MIIDVHAHLHPRAVNQMLDRIAGRTNDPGFGGGVHPDTDDEAHVQRRLEMMQDADVSMQVLSPAAGRAPYARDEGAAVEAATLENDVYARIVKQHPDKFKAFVSLPLPHIAASVRELQRGMDDLGMIGVNMHISALDRSVAEDEFLPLYEEVNRRRGIIFYHPSGNGIRSPMIMEYGLGGAAGTSMEDAVIAMHLIAKKIHAKYPDITCTRTSPTSFLTSAGRWRCCSTGSTISSRCAPTICRSPPASPAGASTTTRWATARKQR